jgi:hypothetical protein
MADFDDVTLQRSAADEPPPPRRPGPLLAIGGLALVVAAVAIWYFGFRERRTVDVRTETTRTAEDAPDAARPPAEAGEDIPLPPLSESDGLVRDLVSRLSSHPRVAAWLTTDDLIRNLTVVTVNIANGRTPSGHLKTVAPTGKFAARPRDGTITIDPSSYARYDTHAEAVGALDARGTARLYATLKPRIEEAYKELGAREPFDATLERAIVALLRTPIVEGDVPLTSDSVSYKFADPALESLTQAQRQFLRMGPRNMRTVQNKLRELAPHLGIPSEVLPPERVIRGES